MLFLLFGNNAVLSQSSIVLFPTQDEIQKVRLFFGTNKNIVFSWSAPSANLRLKIGSLSGYYNIKSLSVKGVSQNIRPDSISLPIGRYYAIVTNSDSSTLSGIQSQNVSNSAIVYSNQVEFIVESQTPPSSLGPIGNETSNTPLFQWTSVPGVPAYMVLLSKTPFQVTRDPATNELSVVGASLVWRYITTNTSSIYGSTNTSSRFVNIVPAPLIPGNEYNYTILNVYDPENPAYASDVFGGVVSFKYVGVQSISPPLLREPVDNAVLENLDLLTFRWDPVANANVYTVYLFKRTVSTSGAKQEIDVPFSNVAVSSNALVDFPAKLNLTDGKYVWYVSASDANGNGNASKTFAFNYSVDMGVVRFEALTTESSTNNNLVGYEVRAKAINGGVTPGNAFVTVNDRYMVDSLVTGTYQITCVKQGYVDTTIVVAITNNGTTSSPISLSFQMRPYPSTISGTVTDQSGKSIGAANVKLINQLTNAEKNIVSSSNGQFSISTENGTYALQASKAGFLASTKTSVTVSRGEQKVLTTPLAMTLDQATANGTVVNDIGAAITLATVTATQGSSSIVTTTNAAGTYSLTLTSGAWSIAASKDGFVVPAPKQLQLSANQTQQVENIVLLPNANTINGSVYELITQNDQTGSAPLENTVVSATPSVGTIVTAVTNSQGQFSLSLKQGSYRIVATRTSYTIASGTLQQYDITVGVGQTVTGINFSMRANPSSISGIVSFPDGTPISGAQTSIANVATVLSKLDGTYTLSVPPGTFTITETREGYSAPKPVSVSVTAGQNLNGINFEMSPNAGVISGSVKSSGEAVVGVLVTAKSGNDSVSTTTSSLGEYSLSLTPGTWQITASKTGFISSSNSFTIGPGQRSTGNVFTIVSNTAVIRGTVSDGTTTLRNAPVRITETSNLANIFSTVSKDDGTYAMTVPAQVGYTVSVSQNGYATKTQVTSVLSAGTTELLQFVLSANPASITGVIQDNLSKPLYPAKAYLQNTNGVVLDSANTDNNGKYTIGSSAGSYTIRSSRVGYRSDSIPVSISVGQILSNINLKLTENFAVLTGTVTSAGSPLSGVLVNISSVSGGSTVTTGSDGSFIIPQLLGGVYTIRCTKNGYSDSVLTSFLLADGQSRNISLSLTLLDGKITGVIKSKTGQTVPSASVSVKSVSKLFNAVSDANGSYAISSVPLGKYFISAIKSGYSSTTVDSLEITSASLQGVSTISDFSFNLLRIKGNVKDSLTGSVINDAAIAISGPLGSGSAVANSQGEFTAENLSPGPTTYSVTISKTGYTSLTQSVSPTSADTLITINALLSANIGKITGTVKDGNGNPLPFSVSLKATSSASTFTTISDANGIFSFDNVANGTTYTVATDIFKSGYDNVNTVIPFPPKQSALTGIALVVEPKTAELKGNAGVADASLELTEASGKIAPRIANSTTDFSYSFKFLPQGSYLIKVKKEGFTFTPSSSSVTLTTGQIASTTFSAIADTSSILINVVDHLNVQAPGVTVSCVSADTSIVRIGTTNAGGNVLFSKLPASRTYIIRTSKSGYSSSPLQASVVLQANVLGNSNFIVTPNSASFHGFVARATSLTLIANVQISARRLSTGEQFSTVTSDLGKYSFSQMAADSFVVIASKQGYTADTTLLKVESGSNITILDTLKLIPSTVNAEGFVRYEGKGIGDVSVTATSSSTVSTKTDANGRFSLSELPVRTSDDTTIFQLKFEKTGITTRYTKLIVPRSQLGQTLTVSDIIVPSGKIKLIISDGKEALSGVKVVYTEPNSSPVESYTPSNGIFETAKVLEAGEYRFAFIKENLLSPNDRSVKQVLVSDTSVIEEKIELPYFMVPLSSMAASESTAISVRAKKKMGNPIASLYYKRKSQAGFTKITMSVVGDSAFTGYIPPLLSTELVSYYTEVKLDSLTYFTSEQKEVAPIAKGILSFMDFEPSLSGATLRLNDTYSMRIIVRDGANAAMGKSLSDTTRGKISWNVSDTNAVTIKQKDTLTTITTLKVGTFTITVNTTVDNIALSKSFVIVVKEIVLKEITIGGTPAGNELNNRSRGIQLTIGSNDTSGKFINIGNNISWTLFPQKAGTLDSAGFLTIDSTLIGKITVTALDKLSKLQHIIRLNIIATIDSTRSFYLTDKNGMEIEIPQRAVLSPIDLLIEDASFGPAKKHVYIRSSGKNFVAAPNLYFFNYKGGALNGDTLTKPATFRTAIHSSLKLFDGEKIIGLYDPTTVEWKMLPASAAEMTLPKGSDYVSEMSVPALQTTMLTQLKAQYTVLAQNLPLGLKYSAVLPSPFSPEIAPVKIGYLLTTTDQHALVSISIYNIRGELVRTLFESEAQYPGRYGSRSSNRPISWDGKTNDGSLARNGRYIIQIRAKDSTGEKVELLQVVLIK